MNNNFLLENINKMNFFEGVSNVLNLLNKHKERLIFVKSSRGLKNVLFLSEINAKSFDSPYFLRLDKMDNLSEESFLSGKVSFNLDVILVNLEDFFTNNNLSLYVEIGFACSHPTQNTMTKIYQSMLINKKRDIHDVTLEHLEYPSWYSDCPHASAIIVSEKTLNDLKILGDKLHLKAINDYKKIIDEALSNNDFETFSIYSEKLMKLTAS